MVKSESGREQKRIPPNQKVTTGWPVLHYGHVPDYKDLSEWDLKIGGLVDYPMTLTFDDIKELPQHSVQNDIHCVTGWSKLDNRWEGVLAKDVVKEAKIKPEARFVMLHAEEGFMTNVPIEDFMMASTLLAHSHNGHPLTPEHGYPLRLVIPHLYFWKSCKWVRAIEFRETNKAGFWERNGYHMYGDPFNEQRFSWD